MADLVEYLTLVVDWQEDPTRVLNEHGRKGWDLVAALPAIPAVGSDWSHRFLLKRKYSR